MFKDKDLLQVQVGKECLVEEVKRKSKSSKKAKLAVPHITLTTSTKRTAELDLKWSECIEGK